MPVYTRTTLGELAMGSGHIRIAGALTGQEEQIDEPHPGLAEGARAR